jgi:hypothetical protein
MKTYLKSTLALLGVLAVFPATAQGLTGNELLEKLKAKDIGGVRFVTGVVDAVGTTQKFFRVNPAGLPEQLARDTTSGLAQLWGCYPAKSTYGQVIDVVILYLEKRPAIRHLDATMIMAFAMKDAWPCSEEQVPANKSGKGG